MSQGPPAGPTNVGAQPAPDRTGRCELLAKQATPDHPTHELLAKRWSLYAFAARAVSGDDLRAQFEAVRWAAWSYNE
jgi:hypothetical protein